MNAVIFLGPSLPLPEARAILDATYLPPARQADIASAVTAHRPDVIGLVDGEFSQSLSVWHKEILYALDAGIHVFGASSMGALRAAETAAFGMVGVGEVYRLFATGELTDDDEVAVAHGRDDVGYRTLSEPMVNIRNALRRAREAGVIGDRVHDRLIAIAKRTFFPERTFEQLFRAGAAEGVAADVVADLRSFVSRHDVDVKKQDAIALLQTIRALPVPLPRFTAGFQFERTPFFETLYQRDRAVRHDGTDVPLSAIASYAALHLPDFPDVNVRALNRVLVTVLADLFDIQASETQVDEEAQRFWLARRLSTPDQREAWLQRNDLENAELRVLMRYLAICRMMQRWLVTQKSTERTAKIVLDELRLADRYEAVASKAASQERLFTAQTLEFQEGAYADLPIERLVVDHMRATPCRIGAIDEWAEEAGFAGATELRVELIRARLAREGLARVAADIIGALTA